MTEVMAMSAPAGVNLSTYTYTSAPRIVQNPRKSANRGNGNPMYDRRVVRGSNYAKRFGGENEPETYNQRRQEFREKLEARARLRRESHGLANVYPSHTTHARHRVHAHSHAQTENYYEPLERPPEAEVGIQTESWGEDGVPPPVVFQSPPGVDASTQVYEDELYDEEDGAMAVAALVARTLREAAVEVLMEEKTEDERLAKLEAELLGEKASADEDQPENNIKAEGQEGEEGEERTDPEGKETSPLDTEEPARSPVPSEDVEKDATLTDDEGTPQDPPPEVAGESEPIAA